MPKFCPPYCGGSLEQDVMAIAVTVIALAPFVIPAAFALWSRFAR